MPFVTSGKLLQGIIVPTVTPLTCLGGVDEGAVVRIVERVVRGGVSGLFVIGTTGEGPALPLAVRRRVVELTCSAVARRVPVVVAAIETSVDAVLETSAHAAEHGADAIAIAPPFYLNLSEGDIVRFGHIVNDRSALPAYLYNVPFGQLPQFSLAAIEKLAACERILGLKDSSGNFEQMCRAIEIFAHRPECSVLVGPERLIEASLRAGADGGVSGGANLFPELYAGLYKAFVAGDPVRVDALQSRVLQVERDFYGVGDPQSSLVRGLKTALSLEGVCETTMTEPYLAPTEAEVAQVAQRLAVWKEAANTVLPGML
jgi:dihydrodipicolinate synthase/N-acetylneuraminate lyase